MLIEPRLKLNCNAAIRSAFLRAGNIVHRSVIPHLTCIDETPAKFSLQLAYAKFGTSDLDLSLRTLKFCQHVTLSSLLSFIRAASESLTMSDLDGDGFDTVVYPEIFFEGGGGVQQIQLRT
jgi:hypothetical protein